MTSEELPSVYVPKWFEAESALWDQLADRVKRLPFDAGQHVRNLRLFATPSTVARVLWFDHLYRQILQVPGGIHVHGTYLGGDLVLWDNLRQLHEPGMRGTLRHIAAFDTFGGHAGTDPAKDGDDELVEDGAFGVQEGYEQWLGELMNERGTWFRGGGRVHIIKGDIQQTYGPWFDANPHEGVALAYLDYDLYRPTLHALETLWNRMPTGGIIAFDEIHNGRYPGETRAVQEMFGTPKLRQWEFTAGGWCYMVKGDHQ